MNKFNIEISDLKVGIGAFLSLVTAPEISIPHIKDILTIGVSIFTLIYTALRIYSEFRKFRRFKKISKNQKNK